jgi:hypothetical protein
MSRSDGELPELPEPSMFVVDLECRQGGWIDGMAWEQGEFTKPMFTADQMRAYGEACRTPATRREGSDVDTLAGEIELAARDLPDGWLIKIGVENGAGWVDLFDPLGRDVQFDGEAHPIASAVRAAVKAAMLAATPQVPK